MSRKGISTARSKNDVTEVRLYNQMLKENNYIHSQRSSISDRDTSFSRVSQRRLSNNYRHKSNTMISPQSPKHEKNLA